MAVLDKPHYLRLKSVNEALEKIIKECFGEDYLQKYSEVLNKSFSTELTTYEEDILHILVSSLNDLKFVEKDSLNILVNPNKKLDTGEENGK